MDPYGMDPTPEEQQAALLQALKARLAGQQQPMQQQSPDAGDLERAWGNLGILSGDPVLSRFGANQIQQAQQVDRGDGALLLRAIAAQKNGTKYGGMIQALKTEFPEVAAKYPEGTLTEDSAKNLYLQLSADRRTNSAQQGADRRVHYTQEKTGERFEKHYGQVQEKQAADLGGREAYGFVPIDPNNPKPMTQKQAEDLQDQAAARDIIETKGNEMLSIYKMPGALVPGTTANTRLRAATAAILPQILKTEAVGGMTEGHQQLIHAMIDDPTKLANFLNDERIPTMIRDAMRSARANVEHRANSLGRASKRAVPADAGGAQGGNFNLGGDVTPQTWDDESEKRLQELEARAAKRKKASQ